jgi:dihydropteroate synthase
MHMQGTPLTMQLNPTYRDVVGEVADFFRQQFAQAVRSGVDPMCIAFDPGIGFGKTVAHNLELLANLPRLQVESRPLVVGVSRKSFLGKVSGLPEDRANSTVALTALLRGRGAHVLRVHDVLPNVNALRTAEAVLAATR